MMIIQNKKGTMDQWEMFIEQTGVFGLTDIFASNREIKEEIEDPELNEIFVVQTSDIKEEIIEMEVE